MKKRILSLVLAFVMAVSLLPMSVFATVSNEGVIWSGAMNFNDANNQVTTTISSMTTTNRTELKWQYPLNNTVIHGGAYYAGSQVIVGNYLYASGGHKLHKISLDTGICDTSISVPETAKLNEVQYLCYGGGYLYFAIRESITAYKLDDLTQVWSAEGNFGQYHPVQYIEYNNTGYIWCNGNVLKASDGKAVPIKQKDSEEPLDISSFAWSSGAQVGNYFYVTDKTNVYAIDMGTWTVADSKPYYDGTISSSYNTSGQVAYDSKSERLFWGCKNSSSKNLYSIKVGSNGLFEADSLKAVATEFTSVNLPVVHNGKVYLVGQGKPFIAVFNIDSKSDEITLSYTVGNSSVTVQTNPVLSTTGKKPLLYFFGFDGKLYVMEDNGESGSLIELAQSPNPSNVTYPNSYEPFAMDNKGNIYCYNESGYLFCYGRSLCEVPTIETDLPTELQKVQLNGSDTVELNVKASVYDGGKLSYQWQSSANKTDWDDIENATDDNYTPSTEKEGTTYYRCVITNTKDSNTASTTSSAAQIEVKDLSANVSLNILANTSNSLTSGNPQTGTKYSSESNQILYVENFTGTMKYLALGATDFGSFAPLKDQFTLYQGLPSGTNMPTVSAVSNSDLYTNRYYRSAGFQLPFVASVDVTAENGTSEGTVYIVVDNDAFSRYAVKVTGLTSNDATHYSSESGISFTDADQTVSLDPQTETIGSGEEDKTHWTWSSSNPSVATVDENGVVKSVGGGEATITFSCGQLTATCPVKSEAAPHTTHIYSDGVCSVCGTKKPAAVAVKFSLVDESGKFVFSKDGTTELYKASLSVGDTDCDGKLTLMDAFTTAHKEHSVHGTEDFAFETSDYGPYITKLWGADATVGVGYYQNGSSANGLMEPIKKNDDILAFFYRDRTNWADLYTSVSGAQKIVANTPAEYTVSGANGIPNGADVKVYDAEGKDISSLATKVDEFGKYTLTISKPGTYTAEICGSATFTTPVWDSATSTSIEKKVTAPVIPSRISIEVLPQVEKTVYVSISGKNGQFVTNKNGDEMWRFPVTASDDAANPDGQVTIKEVLVAAHKQYHTDGISALAHTDDFITKLWGESNGGNCSYYFNDLYMSGSGTKTGTNDRPFQDKLLNTVVEDNDSFYIYSFQATDWAKGDLYTYFDPISETATAGTAKTLTIKSAGGYGSNANKLETSLVKVTDSAGMEQTDLNTTVGADGTFTITFPSAGIYTVEVRTNGTNYVTPSRCTVTVTPASAGSDEERETVWISVVDPQGKTYLAKTEYPLSSGETAFSLLEKTGLDVTSSSNTDYGVYVEAINGFGEFDAGSESGWMYKVNGEFPQQSSDTYTLSDGDYVEWVYTRELGNDIGGKPPVLPEPELPTTTLTPEVSANSKGEVQTEVTATDIKNAIAQGKTDGSTAVTIAPEIKGEATSVTVEVPKAAVSDLSDKSSLSLTVSTGIADVTIPNEGLAEMDGKLTVSTAAQDDAVKVEVAVGGKPVHSIAGGLQVTIPTQELSPSSVLVILSEDGTETIVKKSSPGEDGLAALLEGSATVKVVDNAKAYPDTEGHWGQESIAFVSSREIFTGTPKGFEPNETMNRAMVVTTLFRLEDAAASGSHGFADVPGDTWYTDAVTWASGNAIVNGTGTGFSPNGSVTREQLAAMIYRYADYIGMDTSAKGDLSSFRDLDQVSDWATDALAWAVGCGLLHGKGDSTLDPSGNATRAEVAAIYQRMITRMVG